MREQKKKPPQFFIDSADPGSSKSRPLLKDRAIYRLPNSKKNSEVVLIAVACVEGGGNAPRNAAFDSENIKGALNHLEREFKAVVSAADLLLKSLKALQPGSVEVEFGVELGGKMGIPLVTEGSSKANFKVTLKWEKTEK
ncbi:MAG: hypothetical protein KIT42_12120 [Rhodocyclaceae bacterium]|nr:hypothetical protein [Rhodocyclaceae bacterium]